MSRTDAYYGTSTKIRDTLNNLILKQPQSWQTTVRHTTHRQTLPTCAHSCMFLVSQVGLPFRQIQGTVRPRLTRLGNTALPHCERLTFFRSSSGTR